MHLAPAGEIGSYFLVARPGDAVEITRTDGSVDVAELWKRSAGVGDGVEIPRSDGSVDVAELW